MLKLLNSTSPLTLSTTKCGEIFCHNFKDFTIFCTFCQIKSFHFEDFQQHLQNVHWEDIVQYKVKSATETIECNKYLDKNVKEEDDLSVNESNILEDEDKGRGSSDSSELDNGNWSDEDKLVILKKTITKKVRKKRKCHKNRNYDVNGDDNSTQETEMQNSAILKNNDFETSPNHNKKTSKTTDYTCPECPALYKQKKHLDQHVYDLHNGYKCSLCDKRFRRSYHVASHLKTHAEEKKFICPEENCKRAFTENLYLQRHLEIHTMERAFVCNFTNCGKAFHTKRRLISHQFIHKETKRFVCDMCGMGWRSNNELIIHQRVHTGEKPFPCEVCHKPFISKVALKEHMISHSEIRPYVCGICNKSFANRRVMVRHSFIHSEEKTFKCKLCESAFRHPNSLQGHMRNVHRQQKVKKDKILNNSNKLIENLQ